jgi:hypothetical protein
VVSEVEPLPIFDEERFMRGAQAEIPISGFLSETNPKSKIQNRKWVGIFAVVLTFALCGARVEAQQPTKVPRIGFLSAPSPSAVSARAEAFRQALRDLGYVEGKDIAIE